MCTSYNFSPLTEIIGSYEKKAISLNEISLERSEILVNGLAHFAV